MGTGSAMLVLAIVVLRESCTQKNGHLSVQEKTAIYQCKKTGLSMVMLNLWMEPGHSAILQVVTKSLSHMDNVCDSGDSIDESTGSLPSALTCSLTVSHYLENLEAQRVHYA